MAEGGAPAGEGRAEEEPIEDLHLLFARDLITYVMRRKVPGWTFSPPYSRACPVTPFSYRIRNAVDFYLNKECVNFDTLFHLAFMDEAMNHEGYKRVITLAVRSVFNKTNSYNDLLRFLFLFAHFTVMAWLRGVELAPYFALFNMKTLLNIFTDRKNVNSEVFYGELGFKAQELIHEDTPITFHEFYR